MLYQGVHGFEGRTELLALSQSRVGLCASLLLDDVETGGADLCPQDSSVLFIDQGQPQRLVAGRG
jgi:hypothetical protein